MKNVVQHSKQAFDHRLGTFWADLGQGPAWVGLDFTSHPVNFQCVKIVLPGVLSLQPALPEIQVWDGKGSYMCLSLDDGVCRMMGI